jgi:hypothetical protein
LWKEWLFAGVSLESLCRGLEPDEVRQDIVLQDIGKENESMERNGLMVVFSTGGGHLLA